MFPFVLLCVFLPVIYPSSNWCSWGCVSGGHPPGTSGTKDQMVAPPGVVGAKVAVMPEVSWNLLRLWLQ